MKKAVQDSAVGRQAEDSFSEKLHVASMQRALKGN